MAKPLLAARTERAIPNTSLADLLSLLLIVVPAAFVAMVNVHISYDDAFITYRYAYNLATGQGFVYNPGEWFMGTTAPFYGLLLGMLGWLLGPDAIPTISGVISGLSLVLTGVALYTYGRLHQHALCGLLAGLFFVCNRLLPLTFGGEMLFQAALILWAFVLYRLERTYAAAFLLALAVLTRMDSVIALGVVGLHYVVTRRHLPWHEILIVLAVLAPFALLSWWFYGSLLPVTLDAKLAQRDSGLWPSFLGGLTEWIRAFTIQGSSELFPTLPAAPNAIRFMYFIVVGLPAVLVFFRFWLVPLAWVALYVLGYTILNVPFYHWYVVPVAVGLMILAACGVAGVVEAALAVYRRLRGERTAASIRGVLSALAVLVLLPGLVAQVQQTRALAAPGANPAERLYDQAGEWLRANTAPDASVGYFEIGRLGYAAQRTIVDPLGLLDPATPPHLAEGDLLWTYQHYRPDYILYNDAFAGWFARMLEQPWFAQEYRQVAQLSRPDYPPTLTVYERVADE